MPYRHLPPHARPWWEKGTALWFLAFIAQGVAGLMHPLASSRTPLGTAQLAFSVIVLALALGGLTSWLSGHRNPERWFMFGLAFMAFIQGVGIWLQHGPPGAQTGLTLIGQAIAVVSWGIGVRREFGVSRSVVEEVVVQIADASDGRTG